MLLRNFITCLIDVIWEPAPFESDQKKRGVLLFKVFDFLIKIVQL